MCLQMSSFCDIHPACLHTENASFMCTQTAQPICVRDVSDCGESDGVKKAARCPLLARPARRKVNCLVEHPEEKHKHRDPQSVICVCLSIYLCTLDSCCICISTGVFVSVHTFPVMHVPVGKLKHSTI